MPNKIKSHDSHMKERLNKIPTLLPRNLERARKYRSSYNWQQVAAQHKLDNPLCCDVFGYHAKEGMAPFVEQTHHIQPLATHYHIRALESNLASVCIPCHDRLEKLERSGKRTAYLFVNN